MQVLADEYKMLRGICQESFYEFLKEFWPVIVAEEPVFNWHVKYLCDELQTMAERIFQGKPKKYDLVINVPPGSTKTTILSQALPAWVWTRMPSFRFIVATYKHELSLRDAVRCRELVESEIYQKCFPWVKLREDENLKGLFTTTEKGGRLSVGVRGSVTGFHGHMLIVDDPLNPEQAISEADLRKVNRWMTTTLPSRGIHKSDTPIVLCGQRLSYGDPSGEFLEKKKNIKHINIPAELTDKVKPPELRKFYVNKLMDPVRMNERVLADWKLSLGAYGYSAQILQDPVPLEGAMFDVGKFVIVKNINADMVRLCRSWDKAGTKDGGKYTVGVLMGVDKFGRFWVLDVVRDRLSAIERNRLMLKTAEQDEDKWGEGKVIIRLEVEGGSGGKESGERSVQELAGFRVIPYHPTGEKTARAFPYASQVGGGNVMLLDRPWTKPYIEEHRLYPHWKYLDQVDAGADANMYLSKAKRRIGAL
jgi:predicted phage terminase large subunit-like protein